MQLSTERHVSTLQGHHQAYKIMVLVKIHAVILPRDPVVILSHVSWLIPLQWYLG